jgi:hypothetical protein
VHPTVNERFLREQRLENDLTIVQVDAVQVLCFCFVFGQDLTTVEHSKLGDVEEHLEGVHFSVLNGVKAQVELS